MRSARYAQTYNAERFAGAISRLSHGYPTFKRLYLAILALSPLWMAWDPTYAHMRRARLQGRRVNVHGRRTYIVRTRLEHIPHGANQCTVAAIVHVAQSTVPFTIIGITRIQATLGCAGSTTKHVISAEPLCLSY